MTLRSPKERLFQTLTFEAGGLLLAMPLYRLFSDAETHESAVLMLVLTLAVMIWSPLHNTVFDWLDLTVTGRAASDRPVRLRMVHAISHEVSAVTVSLPILLTLGGHTLAEALLVEFGLTLLYTGYAFFFHMVYDRMRPVALAVA